MVAHTDRNSQDNGLKRLQEQVERRPGSMSERIDRVRIQLVHPRGHIMRHRDRHVGGTLHALARGAEGLFRISDEGRNRAEEVGQGDEDEEEGEDML